MTVARHPRVPAWHSHWQSQPHDLMRRPQVGAVRPCTPSAVLHRQHSSRLTICCTHRWQSSTGCWAPPPSHTCVLPRCSSRLHMMCVRSEKEPHHCPLPRAIPQRILRCRTDRWRPSTRYCATKDVCMQCLKAGLPCPLQRRAHHLLLHPQVAPLDQLLRLCQRHEAP